LSAAIHIKHSMTQGACTLSTLLRQTAQWYHLITQVIEAARPSVLMGCRAGNRMQVHRVGDTVHYFSRARNEHGAMASYSAFDRVVRDALTQEHAILDCEIVIWNKARCALARPCL
jgi:hypothetical protein